MSILNLDRRAFPPPKKSHLPVSPAEKKPSRHVRTKSESCGVFFLFYFFSLYISNISLSSRPPGNKRPHAAAPARKCWINQPQQNDILAQECLINAIREETRPGPARHARRRVETFEVPARNSHKARKKLAKCCQSKNSFEWNSTLTIWELPLTCATARTN